MEGVDVSSLFMALTLAHWIQASGEVIPFYLGAMKLHGTPRNQEVDEVVRPNAFPM